MLAHYCDRVDPRSVNRFLVEWTLQCPGILLSFDAAGVAPYVRGGAAGPRTIEVEERRRAEEAVAVPCHVLRLVSTSRQDCSVH